MTQQHGNIAIHTQERVHVQFFHSLWYTENKMFFPEIWFSVFDCRCCGIVQFNGWWPKGAPPAVWDTWLDESVTERAPEQPQLSRDEVGSPEWLVVSLSSSFQPQHCPAPSPPQSWPSSPACSVCWRHCPLCHLPSTPQQRRWHWPLQTGKISVTAYCTW